ncbi:uncharacterized protein [Physcomitrium patens]|uniref:RNA polymerase III subunit Rpc25 domain-containing protein n=1 Tax=Physcomitrium patens TaxID=3218 RepID=A0A7I4FT84_PHYPA|nr:DNA-directed RNA polymerase III subunit RPC8-like isoform X2 [Physcomitrium patens]|eukprot:XP_024379800.1 DNA-directed RNA polymerase III subunit RPC8-like isoform X2 [Physcomitrella patens]
MFMLAELQDTLKVPPQSLSLALQDAITQELANLYFDKVDFRLVMFRPFVGEVLIAKLKRCDKAGLYLSLGSFFEDIHIPEHLLQQPSKFDEEEKLWIWNYNGADMFMDLEEDVRFRVVQVKYPPIPIEQEKDARPFAPMAITGDINADGLGLVAWWS